MTHCDMLIMCKTFLHGEGIKIKSILNFITWENSTRLNAVILFFFYKLIMFCNYNCMVRQIWTITIFNKNVNFAERKKKEKKILR